MAPAPAYAARVAVHPEASRHPTHVPVAEVARLDRNPCNCIPRSAFSLATDGVFRPYQGDERISKQTRRLTHGLGALAATDVSCSPQTSRPTAAARSPSRPRRILTRRTSPRVRGGPNLQRLGHVNECTKGSLVWTSTAWTRGTCVNTEWTTLAASILSSTIRGQEPLLELDAVRTGGRGTRLPLL